MHSEAINRGGELVDAVERAMAKRTTRQNAEPDLDLVQPAPMLGGENKLNARMPGEPSCGVVTGSGADVIGDDDQATPPVETHEMVEKRKHVGDGSDGRNPSDDVAGFHIEGGENVLSAAAFVLELQPRRLSRPQRSRVAAAKGLNARLLVQA